MSTTGFDLDGRVRDRASEDITIGGRIFHPRKQDWKMLREIDRAQRVLARATRASEKAEPELQAKAQELEDAGKIEDADKVHDEILEAQKQVMLATAAQLAVQIQDDKAKQPTAEFVFEHLDFSLIGPLVAYLNPTAAAADEDASAGPR